MSTSTLAPPAAARQESVERYSPDCGPIRLRSWSEDKSRRGIRHFDATIGIRGRDRTISADALGPIAAMSGALHDAGISLEILSFHQQRTPDGTTTFVNCEHEGRRHWAMALADDATDSALKALVAAANILSR